MAATKTKSGPKPKMNGIVSGVNIIGMKIGNMTVVKEVESRKYLRPNGWTVSRRRFMCVCDCGNKREYFSADFLNGDCTSCGCKKADRRRKLGTTHGMSGKSEYYIWSLMKRRCFNEKDLAYHYYGGRGITVCPQWVDSFETFLKDVGMRPSPKHSLDRVDNNKGYEPNNVRWATRKEQSNNMSSNIIIDVRGEKMTRKQFSEKLGIKYNTLIVRLKYGWDIEKIINTPVKSTNEKKKAQTNKQGRTRKRKASQAKDISKNNKGAYSTKKGR